MTELINDTKNQHFISQVELRWNSIDRNRPYDLIKINRFKLCGENNKLLPPERKFVKGLSSITDIFTLDVIGDGKRINLEKFFGYFEEQYDNTVSNFTSAIETKIRNAEKGVVKIDGTDFFTDIKFFQKIKFMNFIRNPNNIRKALKLFGFAKDYIVLGQGKEFQLIIDALIKNKKGHRKHICDKYQVSESEFDSWIKLLLLFVYTDENMENSSLDGMMEEFFKADELYTAVIIGYYTDNSLGSVLIPDIGSIVNSDMTYLFNISSNCFIALEHNVIDSEYCRDIARQVAEKVGQPFTNEFFEKIKKNIAGSKQISIFIDDEKLLSGYNKRCIDESSEYVYSCSSTVHGADIVSD
ncbi:hypothetical protein [Dickeya zeae]|uniref:hypothetical protein n=1 Tax=Dickeya zeae TaxID=204042 RepID=UPI0003A34A33|nr:hypothetical protein [Dickeya zeae]